MASYMYNLLELDKAYLQVLIHKFFRLLIILATTLAKLDVKFIAVERERLQLLNKLLIDAIFICKHFLHTWRCIQNWGD